jgi:membrane-bound serine protease (ClpP class)
MMIGIYGLFFEFYNPGFMLPGVAGAICLLLGLFALQMLPVNYAGLALIVLGIAFMVAEMFLATFGVLGVGGIVAFAFGAVMLIDTDLPGFGIPKSLIIGLSMATMAFIFFVSTLALRARRRPPVSGADMAGGIGIMLNDAAAEGWARVQGERWQVRCTQPLKRNQEVRIVARDGLTLTVEPIGNQGE